MAFNVGDKFKNNITGKVYELKKIEKEWALLEEESKLSQILLELENLRFLYGRLSDYPDNSRSLL